MPSSRKSTRPAKSREPVVAPGPLAELMAASKRPLRSALADLLELGCKAAAQKHPEAGTIKLGQLTEKDLVRLVNQQLQSHEQITYSHVNLLKQGLRERPFPDTLIHLAKGIGALAEWGPARIQRESIKLLLAAGYDEIPGLIPTRIDATFMRFQGLLATSADTPAAHLSRRRIRVGLVPYGPFVHEERFDGFARDVAQLMFESLMPGKASRCIDWQHSLSFDEMLPALDRQEVDLVVSGVFETVPRSLRTTHLSLPLLRESLVAVVHPECQSKEGWDRHGVRVVARRGEVGVEYAEAHVLRATRLESPSDTSDAAMLEQLAGSSRRADVALVDRAATTRFIQRHPEFGSPEPLVHYRVGFLVRRDDDAWADVLRQALRVLTAQVRPLVDRYWRWSKELEGFLPAADFIPADAAEAAFWSAFQKQHSSVAP